MERIKETAAAQNVASETPLAIQLALIEAYAKGQAMIYQALSDKVALIPSDIQMNTNSVGVLLLCA